MSKDPDGRLKVCPAVEPAANALLHDGTNARLEDLLADAQQNALYYQTAMQLLKNQYDSLLTAVRGKVG